MAAADFSRIVNHALVPAPGAYEIDPVHSFVAFRAQHLVVGRVRGRFVDVSGTAVIAEDPAASTVAVTIQTASINTLMPMRDDDLRSTRFLDVARYPTMAFRSLSVTATPDGWLVAGELTVRDRSTPVELLVHFGGSVADQQGNARIAFHARAHVTRTALGLTAELDDESGGQTVGHDISLEIDAELIRPVT